MPKGVLSIDPGRTTGLAWLMPDGEYMTAIALQPEEVWEQIDPTVLDTVVIEQFKAQLISSHGLHTVRIIGGVIALCWKFDIRVIQRPPQARYSRLPFAKEYLDRTKNDTWVVHEQDALAHLIAYRFSDKGTDTGTIVVSNKTGKKLIDFSGVDSDTKSPRTKYGNRRGYGGFKRKPR